MSRDPFDPEAYPEEVRELVEQARQQLEEARQTSSRFEGISADPETIKAALTMHNQYVDPVTGPQYRAEMAKQWGILQDGQTLDDLKALNQQIAEYNQRFSGDPLAGIDPDEITPDQFIGMLDKRYPSQAALEERLRQVEEQFKSQQEQREMEADLRALESQKRDLYRRLEQDDDFVPNDRDREMIDAVLRDRLQRDLVNGNNFHTAYEDAYTAYRGIVDERAAELMKRQRAAPRTTTQAAATPGTSTPVTDINSAMAALRERMASGNSDSSG